jgi:hypothetical protein
VRGHQDRMGTTLDVWAELNIMVDDLAKQARERTELSLCPLQPNLRLPYEKWQLRLDHNKLCKNITNSILQYVSGTVMAKYWNSRQRIKQTEFALVDWQAIGAAMKQLTPARRRWVTKHVSGNCGVKSTLVRWKKKASPNRPCCGDYETNIHVYRCQQGEAVMVWTDEIKKLHQWLQNQDTEQVIIETLCTSLLAW